MNLIRAFLLGMYEFRSSITWRYVRDDMDNAYECGREWAHRLTFRRFEQ